MKLFSKRVIKVLVTVVLVIWMVFFVDWSEVWEYVKKVELWQLAVFAVVYMIGVIISSWKWQYIAAQKNIRLPFWDYFKLYYSATFINNFMPSFVGGDTFKAHQVGEVTKKYYEAAASVLIDRATGLWGAVLLSLVFAFFNLDFILSNFFLTFLNIGLLVVGGVSLLVFSDGRKPLYDVFYRIAKKEYRKVRSLILSPEKRYAHKLKAGVDKFSQMLSRLIGEMDHYNDKGILVNMLLLAFLFSFVGLALANYVLFSALGAYLPILDYLSVIFLISILASAPVSIGNIGVKEWAYMSFFPLIGVDTELAITVVFLSRALQMLLSFLALPLYYHYQKLRAPLKNKT